jgi:hypothetical protein
LSDEELLNLRLRDLRVQIKHCPVADCIDQLYRELADRGLRFRPACWLAEEWFSPDDTPGIGIPFYLAHPRLMRLERHQMADVIGGRRNWCLRLLRHEAGHAVDTAYRLRRRKRYRELFGKSTVPYPKVYRPKPTSRHHVLHLGFWYAQSHPSEDFAETFAEWLGSPRAWKRRYRGWPALAKLEYLDQLIGELAGARPPVASRQHVAPASSLAVPLREYYAAKQAFWQQDPAAHLDGLLCALPGVRPNGPRGVGLSSLVGQVQRRMRQDAQFADLPARYALDQIAGELAWRSRRMRITVEPSRNRTIMRRVTSMMSALLTRYRSRFHEVLV